ncbi:hypothetical protein RJT34_03129 [Clitoria ternatea]|uniref:Uncharacterized protein n=1 Tax=Clitoria ternatea TaxID=43366 RepID=A0AAN9KLK7_CLITE
MFKVAMAWFSEALNPPHQFQIPSSLSNSDPLQSVPLFHSDRPSPTPSRLPLRPSRDRPSLSAHLFSFSTLLTSLRCPSPVVAVPLFSHSLISRSLLK